MAQQLLGQGYEKLIGTRQVPNQEQIEYFNPQSGMAFENPQILANYVQASTQNNSINAGNVFDVIKQPLTPIKVDLPKEVPAATLEKPTSQFDVNTLIAENRKYRDQLLGTFKPTDQEIGLQKQLFKLQNQGRNTELSAMAGLQQTDDKVIPMEFITGQKESISKRANLALQTNAFQQQPVLQNLQLLQQQRQSEMQVLQQQQEFGQFDINLAMKMQETQRAEEKEARDFALNFDVESPAYSVDGKTVYNTQTGKPYTNEQDFFRDFGFTSWDEVPETFIQREFVSDEERIANRNYDLQRDQFEVDKIQGDRDYNLKLGQLDATKYQSVINPITGERMVFNPKTGQYSEIAGGITDSSAPNFGLAPKLYENGAKIADDFRQEQIVKDYNTTLNKYQSVQAIIDSGVGGPGDLALVYEFMKALDPNSVVRETEYATAAESGNIFAGTLAKFNGYFKENGGFLPESVKQSFTSIIGTKFNVATQQYQNVYNEYSRRIDQVTGKAGVGSQFLTDYSGALNSGSDPVLDDLWSGTMGENSAKTLDLNKAINSGGLTFSKVGNTSASFPSLTSYAKVIGNGTIVSGSTAHKGGEIDIDGKIGDPIYSFAGGKVMQVVDQGTKDYGKKVVIQDAQGNQYIYGHLNAFNVKNGQTIPAGYPIGAMGNTGNVVAGKGGDGSHLHIEKRDSQGRVIALNSPIRYA